MCAFLLLTGCDKTKKSWPPREEMEQKGEGAILFRLTSDIQTSDFQMYVVTVRWPKSAAENGDGMMRSQRIEDALGKASSSPPSEVILVRLKPGTYPETAVNWAFTGHQYHWVETRPEKPIAFTVEPGKITVIGRVDVKANVAVTSQDDRGRNFTTASTMLIDDSLRAKTEALDEALSRPEADSRHWRGLLEAARAALPAAR